MGKPVREWSDERLRKHADMLDEKVEHIEARKDVLLSILEERNSEEITR